MKRFIYILIILTGTACILLLAVNCNLYNRAGKGITQKDSSQDAAKLHPSFVNSTIEFTDLNGGDAYPGEIVDASIKVVNNGKSSARNVRVSLIMSNLFILCDDKKDSWDIDTLDVGETAIFNTSLKVADGISSDAFASCKLKISSEKVDFFITPEYTIPVCSVSPFKRHYIPIIGLHSIEDHIGAPIELYTSHFEHLCETLRKYGYETITFTDLLNYLDYGKTLPERSVIITSDDGFQDIYTNAFPILKKYDYKMTVFLVTGCIGNSEADRQINKFAIDRGYPVRPILIWPEIIEMNEYGCEFLSHTVNNVRMGLVSDEEFLYELTQSKKDIESHLGNEVLFFAWPYDNHSDSMLHLLSQAGYRGAVRYWGGIEDVRTINLYNIKRVEFNSYIPPSEYIGYLELHDFNIKYEVEGYSKEVGEEFTVEYTVENKNKESAKITSLELELPDNIELAEVSPSGYVNQYPGISEGIYMWVSDFYTIAPGCRINLIVKLKGTQAGESIIKFKITANDGYINCGDLVLNIQNFPAEK